MTQGYFVEHNGDCWQSVFTESKADLSQLHCNVEDAISYMADECGVSREQIKVVH